MAEIRSLDKGRLAFQASDANRRVLFQRSGGDCDPLNAVDMLTAFNRFLLEVTARYEANERVLTECEQKSQDLLHYIELHDDMNAAEGYKTYRKLAEVRRERRIRKNENELLSPLYSFMKQNPRFATELAQALGKTRSSRETIEKRCYSAKTDVI